MNKLFYISLFFTLTFPLSAQTKIKDRLLFEIVKNEKAGGEFKARGSVYQFSITFFFYQSGRISCKSKGISSTGKELGGESLDCVQASKTKINQLRQIASHPDFIKANEDYQFFKYDGNTITELSITYFSKLGNKKILLTNMFNSENLNLPPKSLKLFLQKIGEINGTLAIQYEIKKPVKPGRTKLLP